MTFLPEPEYFRIDELMLHSESMFKKQPFYERSHGRLRSFLKEDAKIQENQEYPLKVYYPNTLKKLEGVIFLLHGLNEKSWDKYQSWAQYLIKKTGKAVIMIPIAFHMERAPHRWSNPRKTIALASRRNNRGGRANQSTFANAVLSERLERCPERFLISGYQSSEDILNIVRGIRNKEFSMIHPDARIDFFGYSIGAFLAQIMMMANPGDVFSSSKMFLFCGGTAFEGMRGTSKFIMDMLAFKELYRYYLDDYYRDIRNEGLLADIFTNSDFGRAFTEMIHIDKETTYRDDYFNKLSDRLLVFALRKDEVMPPKSIVDTFPKGFISSGRLRVMDYEYAYSHETPFPKYRNNKSVVVMKAFSEIFSAASNFFTS